MIVASHSARFDGARPDPGVERSRGDRHAVLGQHAADRSDPETVPVLSDERADRLVSAVARVALPHEERRCRLEDFDGLLELGVAALECPDLRSRTRRDPVAVAASTCRWRIQLRSVSAFIPSRLDTAVIAAHSLG